MLLLENCATLLASSVSLPLFLSQPSLSSFCLHLVVPWQMKGHEKKKTGLVQSFQPLICGFVVLVIDQLCGFVNGN